MAARIASPIGPVTLTRHGQGRALVLIHGWGGAGADWQPVMAGLTGYDTIALTLPGSHDAPLIPPPDMARLGHAVAEMLDRLDLTDALLLGHSMGGPVAVEAAIAAPARVAGVLGLDTLSDHVFYGGTPEAEITRRRAAFAGDLPKETARMVRAICAPATPDAMADRITAAILSRSPATALLDLRDALFRWRLADRLPHLRCPLRLLNSAAVMAAHALAPIPALQTIPTRIYGAGHFPHLEDPAAILPVLQAELAAFPPEPP